MIPKITFVVPVADEPIYEQCFKRSPLLAGNGDFEVFCQRGYRSAGVAFNVAMDKAANDLIVFCHQDILLPASWARTFGSRLEELERVAPRWGVVGCAGRTCQEQVAAHLFRHDRELRGEAALPAKVRTLDESLIAFRRSSGLRFDEALAGFNFYAVDICLEAESRGLDNYVVDAPCFHQAKNRTSFAAGFFKTEKWILNKWRSRLPVQTLSGRLVGGRYLAYKRMRDQFDALRAACGHKKEPWWTDLPKISPEEHLG